MEVYVGVAVVVVVCVYVCVCVGGAYVDSWRCALELPALTSLRRYRHAHTERSKAMQDRMKVRRILKTTLPTLYRKQTHVWRVRQNSVRTENSTDMASIRTRTFTLASFDIVVLVVQIFILFRVLEFERLIC